jgi:mannose-1-phosphate guanylyltransferase/mannose-1-phosphate guanylyltransferase/mannose-6-phosphate isomerase
MVLPSDHVINNREGFDEAVPMAAGAAREGHLVTFGIQPMSPSTGLGYILQGEPLEGLDGCFRAERFVEKPDAETAQAYVAEGRYTWNSGMFMFLAGRYMEELEALNPAIADNCRQAVAEGGKDLDFFRLGGDAYGAVDNISIDYAVMEKTEAAAVVPADMGWSAVGAWTALLDGAEAEVDADVRSEKPLLAVIGAEDLIVIATDDAVLVVPKDKAQDVRVVSEWLRSVGRPEADTANQVYRPWGYYQVIDTGEKFQAKQLMINPGAKLSLQRHEKRAEHWVVVEGEATVTRGDETLTLKADESTYIPVGTDHRLENKGKGPLRIIEVQSGDYLGEDDIIRLEDDYGRT